MLRLTLTTARCQRSSHFHVVVGDVQLPESQAHLELRMSRTPPKGTLLLSELLKLPSGIERGCWRKTSREERETRGLKAEYSCFVEFMAWRFYVLWTAVREHA